MYNEELCEAKIDLESRSTWLTTTPTTHTVNLPFYLLEWGYFIAGREYYTVRNNNRFLLFYTISGSGSLIYEGKTYLLEVGTVAVIWCGVRHEYKTASETGWEFRWFHYHGAIAHEYFRMIGSTGPAIFHMEKDSRCIELVEMLTGTTTLNGIFNNLLIAQYMTELMTLLSCAIQKKDPETPREMLEKIDSAVQYMERHLDQKITLEEIASTVFISKFHFIRIFNRVMGISPYIYLTNLRVSKAKELLIMSGYSLSEIAAQIGFCDSKNLICNFKKVTGQTPEQYRKANYGFGTREDVNSVSTQELA